MFKLDQKFLGQCTSYARVICNPGKVCVPSAPGKLIPPCVTPAHPPTHSSVGNDVGFELYHISIFDGSLGQQTHITCQFQKDYEFSSFVSRATQRQPPQKPHIEKGSFRRFYNFDWLVLSENISTHIVASLAGGSYHNKSYLCLAFLCKAFGDIFGGLHCLIVDLNSAAVYGSHVSKKKVK